MEDTVKGFATGPMNHAELLEHLDGKPYRLIGRFVITRSTGKQRIIDDAAAGGQSDPSADENILNFCNALQPAHHLSALVNAMHESGANWPEDGGV